MRASRLLALLLHLQARGHTTAAQLADELEVSVRTVYRDVSALQSAGVPLWTESGPGGGIRLLDGWRTDLDGLTADEASVLFLAGAPDAAAELGVGAVLAAAQSKVLSTLPPELRARATRAQERFLLDAPGWFHDDDPSEHLATVAEAVWNGVRLDLGYGRDGAAATTRRVDPLGLVLKAGVWYLVALHRGQPRTYRVSRIRSAVALDVAATRPAGFDLAHHWASASDEFDRTLHRETVTLLLDDAAAHSIRYAVGRRAAAEALAAATVEADGRRRVRLPVESVEVALHQLVGLGGGVEAVDPPELRAGLAAAGRALAARNEGPPPP